MVAFTSPSSSVGMQWPAKFGFPPILDLASSNLNYTQGTRNVFKFGGTSVGSPERLFQLVTIVKAERKRVMSVVVSAMGKNTDLLLDAASAAASGDIDAALALIDRVEELTIRNANDTQRLILGDNKPIEDLTKDIQAFHVPLRQLLLGVSLLREQTLAALDTVLSFGERISATIVAADYVVINTDISGVMTADPRIVGSATSVSHLSHHEALELAIYGTRMFHTRTMVPLINSGVTMLIRNTMDPSGNGTYISSLASADKSVTCTTSLENLSLIEVRTRILQEADRHEHGNVGARVIQCLEHERVHIWLSIRAAHGQSISIVVPSHQEVVARTAIATELKSELQNNEVDTVNCVSPVTMLSIVGEKLNKASANAAKMFTALATAGIDVLAVGQGTSSRSLSCIVHGAKTKTTRSILDKIIGQADKYRQRHNVELRVVGFGSNCTPFQFDPNGIKLDTLVDQLQSCSKATPLRRDCGLYDHARPSDDIVSLIHVRSPPLSHLLAPWVSFVFDCLLFQDLSCPILVDCSGRSDNAAFYASCFAKDIHVIVSNVRSANSVPKSSASPSLHALDPCYFLYNSVVGASLPIFDTLANLLNTGDHLHRVDAALSGTLGYVMRDGVTLSQAIRDAWDHGYMEANPKEDLSGDDVAHKVKVFARALGTSLALSDIEVTPFVPTSILDDLHWANDVVDVEKLVQALEAYDATFDATFVQPALQQGKRLRYVATLVMGTASLSARIELLLVDESHPSFRTQDNDIAVGLTTTEYNARPLVLTGSGTGGSASATGVMRDILTITKSLQGV
ncbi:hypothetical protein DYB37_001412 [Aphanomyces astaci]|uniref:Uncharacterized protein n=1 Tax=Aphanomyces astaci TaxID=112090 RepID=A0A3R6Z0L6_APHAT|nr:hypothetical protein DYB35_000721 [Aphanomyces astaci]RHZ29751.1 hypothetical protein DYB37_001412 [Aphanomyces astaci]